MKCKQTISVGHSLVSSFIIAMTTKFITLCFFYMSQVTLESIGDTKYMYIVYIYSPISS